MRNRIIGFGLSLILPAMAAAQDVTFSAPDANDTLTAALKDASLTLALSDEEGPKPQDYVAAARADYRRLLTALYAAGYYSGTISITVNGAEAAAIAPLDAPGTIRTVAITVAKGERFRFGTTDITPLAPNSDIPGAFARGEIARSDAIRVAASAAVDAWRDNGYARARATDQTITAVHAENRLDVALGITPGSQLRFGPLTVSGNSAVRADRIRQIAGLPEGEVFTPAALTQSERRLRRTGTFDSVAMVEAEENGPDNTLPIEVQLVEAKPRRIGFGLELSSVDGLTVSSFWLHRNLLGGAERFRVEGEVSGIGGSTGGTDYRIATNFNRPAVFGPDTDYFINAAISREDEPTYLIDQAAFETGFTRIINDDLTVGVGLGVLTAREVTDLGTRDYTLVTAPLFATLDRRDNATNAKSGYYLDIDATPFLGLVGAPNGARVYADARAYRTFETGRPVTVAGRLQVGSVLGADLDNAPADFLFYSGGGGTVRGQGYKSLGTSRTVDGATIDSGGLSFVGAQLEARVGVTDKIAVVGFYDYGYVGDAATPGSGGSGHAGAGFGVRYDTGIGPIRLDIGTPASGDDAGQSVQVYIGIGQSF